MKVTIHTDTATLPTLPEGSYFHSRELMELCLRTPRHKPYMVVVTDDDGEVVAHTAAIQMVLDALGAGVHGYIPKDFPVHEMVLHFVGMHH